MLVDTNPILGHAAKRADGGLGYGSAILPEQRSAGSGAPKFTACTRKSILVIFGAQQLLKSIQQDMQAESLAVSEAGTIRGTPRTAQKTIIPPASSSFHADNPPPVFPVPAACSSGR